MALWSIARRNEMLKLSFIERPTAAVPVVQDCGQGESVILPDLAHFVCTQAQPFDMVSMPDGGLFVRQREPRENV
jgi:hypothetical protein